MARYKMARSDGPLRKWNIPARIVGGDDDHIEVDIPAGEGIDIPDAFEPVNKASAPKSKRSKKTKPEAAEADE